MNPNRMQQLNKISALPPAKKISELAEGKAYKVKMLKLVLTAFGNRIVVRIPDGESEFDVFLPERIAAPFVEDQTMVSEMNELAETGLWIIVTGKGKSKGVEWKTSI